MAASKTKRTSSPPNPRTGNSVYIWTFIGVNVAVFLWLALGGGLDASWAHVTAKNGAIAAGIPLLAIVLSNILSDQTKARLVFWRLRHPLPGCRVFSALISTDPRIDVPHLKQKVGRFSRESHSQNALWYDLYRNHLADEKVAVAHRIYLLTRDIACISAVLVILLPLSLALYSSSWIVPLRYAGILSLQYILTASSARNYGKRFVLTVLAEESHLS